VYLSPQGTASPTRSARISPDNGMHRWAVAVELGDQARAGRDELGMAGDGVAVGGWDFGSSSAAHARAVSRRERGRHLSAS
jgi:hypothetical protein